MHAYELRNSGLTGSVIPPDPAEAHDPYANLGSTLLGTAATLAPAAQAAPAAPASSTAVAAPMDSCPCNPPAGIGWNYLDNYFWHSDCDAAGRRNLNTGRWSEYQCTGGGTLSNDKLRVR